eukprot:scaffold492782_cov43-Attheya_sp.AAC.1
MDPMVASSFGIGCFGRETQTATKFDASSTCVSANDRQERGVMFTPFSSALEKYSTNSLFWNAVLLEF